ncbi:CRISPR-associated helicase Cas3/CRISPR-associated endonuclease Cas3-HD [Thermanaeromonas toyohensis ToBE]|uniref:CRISPR-associated helicase Cas3/CRISPR-associated endonuclease Cas3-HD n=2 Tax=Thermanaeromonas TaxID=202949 RepID=A0A1W1VZU6_9FIRM|nr:CRISPR-associated helicase Cas3/CRISPR-associated endonuclease Cas3-HD [Thermanaeromonas toyohensis ToBE]
MVEMRCSLAECLARPTGPGNREYPLYEHLLAVAHGVGRPDGDVFERLRFLAGLLHDAGKTRPGWQKYIRGHGQSVPHAFAGSMLFALCLDELLKRWDIPVKEKQAVLHLGVVLTFFLYEHHGDIPDTGQEYPPWIRRFMPGDLQDCDLKGILTLAVEYFPELEDLCKAGELSLATLERKLEAITLRWRKWSSDVQRYVGRLVERNNPYAQAARLCLQIENSRLVAADRFHAAGCILGEEKPYESISSEMAYEALQKIEEFCRARREALVAAGADEFLLEARGRWRNKAAETFVKEQGSNLFTLELPTGYGKTLTSLTVALEAVKRKLCRRIVYVAPYLSILSQAAAEIQSATGLDVMTYHHLSSFEKLGEEKAEDLERDEDIVLDSWQAPVVVTTFNQLFAALFPARAQHTLRLQGLKNSFVIVDEPQIISAGVWNLFLALMEAAAAELNLKVLLTTATLPELTGGIFGEVVSLGIAQPVVSRFRVETLGEGDEEYFACKAIEAYRSCGSVAVICNTIKDASEVYSIIKDQLGSEVVYFLSGRLTPLHKKDRIEEIRNAVNKGLQVIVVCTQVLEAGVDLSFRVVIRALPVIPSVVQAAGRCNRHGEEEIGRLYVIKLLRGNETDTRPYVYRDGDQRQVTDLCLTWYPTFSENEASQVVREFYKECFRRNTHQAVLQKLLKAAYGYHSVLRDVHPFGPEVPSCGIFVPRWWGKLDRAMEVVMRRFGISQPEDIWELYVRKDFLGSLSFTERKAFMGLMNHFVVQVPLEVAAEIGRCVPGRTILRLSEDTLYREDTGLSIVSREELNEAWFV